jgi:hypothetical protein
MAATAATTVAATESDADDDNVEMTMFVLQTICLVIMSAVHCD